MIIHESDLATVHLGDGIKMLASLDNEAAGVVVTDPPYGVRWVSGFRGASFGPMEGDDDTDNDRSEVRSMLAECVRVVGQGRHLYVFGPSDVLSGLKVSAPCQLVWAKGRNGGGNLSSPWAPSHEPISFAVSKYRHAGQAGGTALPVRMRKGSVLLFTPPTGRNVRHPSEKPVGLLRELVESSSKQGEIVVDPYAGVGSTGVAAILSGRRVVMAELDPRYAEIAVARVRVAESLARQAAGV